MKKFVLTLLVVCGCVGTSVAASYEPSEPVFEAYLDNLFAGENPLPLKPYYTDKETADLCEAWASCAKWAREEYTKDLRFKVIRAALKTNRRTYRHHATQERHLFVEAAYAARTVYLEFTTPFPRRGSPAYRSVSKFPQ